MAKEPKTHRGSRFTWKRDICCVTCLLRLRCLPPVPYEVITDFLIRTKANVLKHLFLHCGLDGSVVGVNEGKDGDPRISGTAREWLTRYLEEIYQCAEMDEGVYWRMVRDLGDEEARAKVAKLGLLGRGYGVIGGEELKLQIQWRKRCDWKAGSELESQVCHENAPQAMGEEGYTWEREQFFEDLVDATVNDEPARTLEPKSRTQSYVAAASTKEVLGYGEEDDWQFSYLDPEKAHRRGLHEEYLGLLRKLKEVCHVINDCNWEIAAIEWKMVDEDLSSLRDSSYCSKMDFMTDPLLPDMRRSFSNMDSDTSSYDTEETRLAPEIIIDDSEEQSDEWQYHRSEDDRSSANRMVEEADKALAEWQGYGRSQPWLDEARDMISLSSPGVRTHESCES